MDVWGAILVLIRRFYLTVPIAALTMFGGYAYAHKVAPEYHATSSFLLLSPSAASTTDKNAPPLPDNPYATMNLTTMLTTLQIDLTTQQSLSAIRAAGGTTNFSAGTVNRSSVVEVTATATDPRQALATAGAVINVVRADLANRQKPYTTNPAYQTTAQVIGAPSLLAPDTKSRTRAQAIALGVALVITVILVLVADGMLDKRARQHRRRERGNSVEEELEPSTGHRTPVVRP